LKNFIYLTIAFLVVIANAFIGHYYSPDGITYTPIVITTTAALVVFGLSFRLIWKIVLVFVFVVLNDIFIKLYSGGRHDAEGLEWIHAFMLFGVVPVFILLCVTIVRERKESGFNRVALLLVFPLLLLLYLYFFYNLGLGQNYS